jgi:hypothetical protein
MAVFETADIVFLQSLSLNYFFILPVQLDVFCDFKPKLFLLYEVIIVHVIS